MRRPWDRSASSRAPWSAMHSGSATRLRLGSSHLTRKMSLDTLPRLSSSRRQVGIRPLLTSKSNRLARPFITTRMRLFEASHSRLIRVLVLFSDKIVSPQPLSRR